MPTPEEIAKKLGERGGVKAANDFTPKKAKKKRKTDSRPSLKVKRKPVKLDTRSKAASRADPSNSLPRRRKAAAASIAKRKAKAKKLDLNDLF